MQNKSIKVTLSLLTGCLLYTLFSFTATTNRATIPQDFDLKSSIKRGTGIYQANCASCHMAEGEGIPSLYPPLANSDHVKDQTYLINGVKNGIKGPIEVKGITYNAAMTGFNLSDSEISDVLNYVRNSWGNTYIAITPKDVAEVLVE